MPTTLCNLATKLPLLIGTLLDQEAKLKRGRFREETMTDIITGALAAFASANLVIQYPAEISTGGDLDLRFCHVASGRNLHLRIQTKRLNASKDGTRSVQICHRSYHQLLHKPTSGDYQFRTLRDAPAPCIPLYMFYNHGSVARDECFRGTTPTVSGVNLAFADDVASELEEILIWAASKPRKIKHNKRLFHLRRHFFDLETIFCPDGAWNGEEMPPPDVVRASLLKCYWAHSGRTAQTQTSDTVRRGFLEPDELSKDSYLDDTLDWPCIRIDQSVKRPTVTFISGRTGDIRTPIIADGGGPRRP